MTQPVAATPDSSALIVRHMNSGGKLSTRSFWLVFITPPSPNSSLLERPMPTGVTIRHGDDGRNHDTNLLSRRGRRLMETTVVDGVVRNTWSDNPDFRVRFELSLNEDVLPEDLEKAMTNIAYLVSMIMDHVVSVIVQPNPAFAQR